MISALKHCNNVTFAEKILNERQQCLIKFGRLTDYSWIWLTAFIATASTITTAFSVYCLMFLFTLKPSSKNVSGEGFF